MSFCGGCGAKAGPTTKFCTSCGFKLGGAGGGDEPKAAKNRVAPNAPAAAPEGSGGWVQGDWTEDSAFDTPKALAESQRWIEAVTGERFSDPNDFVASTRDGVLLCKLVNGIKPGSVPKINSSSSAFAQRENISHFLNACRDLGLKDTQLFVSNDLFEAQRIRTVAITLYWLGRAARSQGFRGPQMRLSMFCKMKCSRCNKPILDENYIVTMDQQWHTHCATCDNCGDQLGEDGYHQTDDGRVLCPKCAGGDPCGGCGKDFDDGDNQIDVGGVPFCINCACPTCKRAY
eukprot:TRINITY_DN1509_c0_g1_i1.p1 TRINITY_DN1509_c0_g1~~TRINITY_DN1509_c0_g1_i1.p1  ORF type:complete len:288 (-),score=52.40 TRINITY_DN1509_c0_g1_i1:797-1660(-)